MTPIITVDRLREILHYEPESGEFRWRVSPRYRIDAGDVAGSLQQGCRRVRIDGRRYRGSRLAWLYMTGVWPEHEVDHINLDSTDNRWGNLREATRAQNQANTRARGLSGLKGACLHHSGAWEAKITVAGKTIHLGHFNTREAAFRAYADAALKYFGEYAKPRTIGDARHRYGLKTGG